MKNEFFELIAGLRKTELWMTLAWNDIRSRYTRSVIGPFWLALSMGFLVMSLGFVYGTIFGVELSSYFPYLTMGMIAWALISSFVIEGSGIFLEVAGLIKQIRIPLSVHIARLTVRSIVIFFHNMLVFVIVALIFQVNPGIYILLFPIGLFLIVINGAWIAIILGGLSLRFRDFNHVIASILQFLFFLTPIIWQPTMLEGRGRFILTDINPLYHAITVLRSPMLGEAPPMLSWIVMTGIAIAGWTLALLFLKKTRKRIPFWV